jgi:hypothetical protein
MILLFGKNIGQLGVVPKSESVVLPQSRLIDKFTVEVADNPFFKELPEPLVREADYTDKWNPRW